MLKPHLVHVALSADVPGCLCFCLCEAEVLRTHLSLVRCTRSIRIVQGGIILEQIPRTWLWDLGTLPPSIKPRRRDGPIACTSHQSYPQRTMAGQLVYYCPTVGLDL